MNWVEMETKRPQHFKIYDNMLRASSAPAGIRAEYIPNTDQMPRRFN
jgi:hypothetical protein